MGFAGLQISKGYFLSCFFEGQYYNFLDVWYFKALTKI